MYGEWVDAAGKACPYCFTLRSEPQQLIYSLDMVAKEDERRKSELEAGARSRAARSQRQGEEELAGDDDDY